MTLFFSAQSTGTQDLYVSSRSDRGSVFDTATNAPFTTMTTTASETNPRVSADGLRLYFSSDFSGPLATGGADLYLSTRTSATAKFPIPTALSSLNSTALDSLAWISPDELQIYFSSARASSPGGINLWFAQRSSRAATFGVPQTLSELNTEANDQGASLSPDQLTIFFSSDRASADSVGKFDLWMATRTTTSSPFGAPVLVPNVNSSADEIDVCVSADGTELFFSSDRAGTEYTFWRSTRSCQ